MFVISSDPRLSYSKLSLLVAGSAANSVAASLVVVVVVSVVVVVVVVVVVIFGKALTTITPQQLFQIILYKILKITNPRNKTKILLDI